MKQFKFDGKRIIGTVGTCGYMFFAYSEDNAEGLCDLLNELTDENERLREELFEVNKELLWATSDEVDRALYFEDEVEELRKEIFG